MPPHSPSLRRGFTLVEIMIVVVILGLLVALAIPAINKTRAAAQDKAILNNARLLASAADQYMTESGESTVAADSLIGPDKFVKIFATVAKETYPTAFTQAEAITITGIAGVRTITYGL